MRRATKVLGFVLAAVLVGGACGGGSSSTSVATRESTSSEDSPADSSAEENRDRNVSAGGFGENGGGIASVHLSDNVMTRINARVFRRARVENVDGRAIKNFRDVFVVTMVSRAIGNKISSILHVDGYETEGDNPATYPMADFGDAGRVSIELTEKSSEWSNTPNAYTVVSRDLLAVSFISATGDGDSAGLIEFYDMSSGKPNTTLGDNGRIVVPKSTGMDDVYDIAFREIGDDGKPRLVVAGLDYEVTEETYADNDLVIAGLTADGVLDPAVGEGGSGTISLRNSLTSLGTNSSWDIRLADPGLSPTAGVIAAAVTSRIPTPKLDGNWWAPDEVELVGLVARAPRSGGPITMEATNGAYVNTIATGLESVRVRNAILDIDNSLDLHIEGQPYGTGGGTLEDFDNEFVTFTGASAERDVVRKEKSVPFTTANDSLVRRGEYIADLSSEGKGFNVELYNDLVELTTSSAICFDDRECNVDRLPGVRKVSDIAPTEGAWTTIRTMTVDASGVHLVVESNGAVVGQTTSLVSLGTDGSVVGGEPPTFLGDFDTYNTDVTEADNELTTYNVRWVDGPHVLGTRRLASFGSDRPNWDTNFILVSDAGEQPREVPLSLPLGIASYSADAGAVAVVDESSIALRADVYSDAGRDMRVYKVSVDNGSVDVDFGVNGYVSVPEVPRDDDCRWHEFLKSGPGVVALLVVDHDLTLTNGEEDCSRTPQTLSWSTFTTTGQPIGSDMATVELDPTGFSGVTDYLFDSLGNLYVVGYADVYESEYFVISNAMVAKFTSAGVPDPSFGNNGVATFDGGSNALFGAGSELVGAVDADGRVLIAAPIRSNQEVVDALVMRLTTTGAIDASTEVESPVVGLPTDEPATPREQRENAEVVREAKNAVAAAGRTADSRQAELPVDSGVTVTATKPVLTALKAVEDRSLTVWWSLPAAKREYVTATAMPGGRTCTSNAGSCIIRGLDPAVAYSVTVALKGEDVAGATPAEAVSVKPVVSLKLGRVASPTTYVRPASRGKATWKVRGGCTLNATNTRITAPKRVTKCRLSVTTAKFGSTPKTTKSVTIVVKK